MTNIEKLRTGTDENSFRLDKACFWNIIYIERNKISLGRLEA